MEPPLGSLWRNAGWARQYSRSLKKPSVADESLYTLLCNYGGGIIGVPESCDLFALGYERYMRQSLK